MFPTRNCIFTSLRVKCKRKGAYYSFARLSYLHNGSPRPLNCAPFSHATRVIPRAPRFIRHRGRNRWIDRNTRSKKVQIVILRTPYFQPCKVSSLFPLGETNFKLGNEKTKSIDPRKEEISDALRTLDINVTSIARTFAHEWGCPKLMRDPERGAARDSIILRCTEA